MQLDRFGPQDVANCTAFKFKIIRLYNRETIHVNGYVF